nr:hypothetical protein [uncultured Prevotella sp.]
MKDNNSQENKNMEAQASAVDNMTTEQFHQLLEENTRKQNELRSKRQEQLADAFKEYSAVINDITDGENAVIQAFRKHKEEFEKARRFHDVSLQDFRNDRSSASLDYAKAKAKITNEMSILNEQLQSERHDIFERYRNSGGATRGRHGRAATPSMEARNES